MGAFLLGVLTKRASSRGTMIGMVIGLLGSLAVGQLLAPSLFGQPGLAWTWNVAVGTTLTMAGRAPGSRPAGGPLPGRPARA